MADGTTRQSFSSPGTLAAVRTIIVVPCFNEALRLQPEAFARFVRATPDISFVFVDDGSTDRTRELLRSLCASDPARFELVGLPSNSGQGEAVRQGLARAFASGAAFAGYWDADLATPLEEIPRFVRALDLDSRCMLVYGCRRPARDNQVRRHPVRLVLGRVFAASATLLLRMRVYDTHCGAKLFRSAPEVHALFSLPFISRWIFDVEILARLAKLRGVAVVREALCELPLRAWHDVRGSKLTTIDFARAPFEMLRIGRMLYGSRD
jgi:glycosyltransferase involved in cell wall biosynthesis